MHVDCCDVLLWTHQVDEGGEEREAVGHIRSFLRHQGPQVHGRLDQDVPRLVGLARYQRTNLIQNSQGKRWSLEYK
jgi:hypothetical protein